MLKYFKMIMKKIIDEFPILKTNPSLVYLDNACSALKMKSAAYEQLKILLEFGSCGGERGVHLLARGIEEKYQIARKYIASSINCSENEIIFTSGTTEGFNILANSFNFKEGDEIIISGLEHNSVFLPFYRIAKIKKLKLKIIPLKNFNPDPLEFKKMITSKTRVLCLSKASNIFGGTVETDEIVEIAFRKNIKVFMDAAQYAPTHKIDVEKLKVDALCFSGHKIGAPYGTGVLYIKNELYDFLSSSKLGGGTIKEIKKENGVIKVEFLKEYKNFEAGIQNYAGVSALSIAYKYSKCIRI
jgi:cysteine desulfurase/selenocysteine lyase